MSLKPLTSETCVLRQTHTAKGRTEAMNPSTSASRWLHYGRIILDSTPTRQLRALGAPPAGAAPVTFTNSGRETSLIGLNGRARVTSGGESYTLGRYDALYIPRDQEITVQPFDEGCDIAELSAQVEGRYAPAYVSYEQIKQDPALHFRAGGPGSSRELNILIGKNVEAGRLLAGVTFSDAGNWTSWPPHEHAEMLEEVYLYIDMPEPAFGVQYVYTDRQNPEIATFVREGDAVVIPQGYHPNVAAPGGRIGFLWFMAAHRETVDRQFGVVNVQPEFAQKGSGLEAARK